MQGRKHNQIRSWSGSELTGGDGAAGGLLTGTRPLLASGLRLPAVGLGLLLLLGGAGKPPPLSLPPLLPLLPLPAPQYWVHRAVMAPVSALLMLAVLGSATLVPCRGARSV